MTLILSGTDGLSDVGGSAATPAIRGTDTNTGIFFPAADTVGISTGGTERATVDSSGNLGLGVTPSAWGSVSRAMQFQNGVSIFSNTSGLGGLGNNVYSNPGTADYYIANGYATRYYQFNGTHVWNTAASGTAGNAITFTQAMTLDASGNLRLGTTSDLSAGDKFTVVGGNIAVQRTSGITTFLGDSTQNGYVGTITNHAFAFLTNSTERARIDSSGNLLLLTQAKPTTNFYGLYVKSTTSSSSDWGFWVDNSSSNNALRIRNDGYLNSASTYSLTGGTANLSIDASGYITRATSSIRYKRDVQTYDKGLSIVLAARPVYYKSSVADANGDVPETQFAGLIAEELDALGLSEFVEYNQEGQPDAVRYGNMVSLCIKAIQEQQAIIETLTARITALEQA